LSYCNLHAHSEFSLLDGVGTPKQRASVAKDLGQPWLNISDHGSLMGVPQHIEACNDIGIKPIVGVEAYFRENRLDQTPENKKAYHLLITAQNDEGWHNLIKLTSEAWQSGFYHKPCVDWELCKKYRSGLTFSSACISGFLPMTLQEGTDQQIVDCVEKHLDVFGENFFLEIMPHDLPAQKITNLKIAQLHYDWDIPIVATNDSHFPFKEWQDTQDVLLMIATGQTVKKREAKKEAGEEVYAMGDIETLHFMSEEEMYESFARYHPDLPKQIVDQGMYNSGKIAEEVEPFEISKEPKIPVFFPDKDKGEALLRKWCEEGLERIDKQDDEVYRERYEYELSILKDKDVIDYILIVGDMVRWAREQHIRISSGRGSAAGSLVSYLSRITTIDPIAHGLLFERFLNPDRKGLPDIDIDFDSTRRSEVKHYLGEKYGHDHVVDLLSLGTFGPKSAIKDVGRVLGIPYPAFEQAANQVPEAKDVGGAGNVPSLTELYESNEIIKKYAREHKEAWKHSLRLEGQSKQLSKHAGGVVITKDPLTDDLPIIKGKDVEGERNYVSAWTDKASAPVISDYGFLKIDVLGIDGLTRQGHTVRLIKQTEGYDVDLDELPVAKDPKAIDEEIMPIFQKGLTLGIWQFGSSGFTSFLKQIKPTEFNDIVAANALYRPGPLDGGDAYRYAKRKNGKEPIEYWHPAVEPFLAETYGILCYQEQMMEIVKALGNFTPGQADDMRKATSKLYRMGKEEARQFMAGYKEQWDKGCLEHDLDQETADYIWQRIVAFGGYSFNKSHAASYGLISVQDAWLKWHYTKCLYTSLMTGEEDRIAEIIREARQLDIYVETPDINRSHAEFTIDGKYLLYGLASVKYIGPEAVETIVTERNEGGPFSSVDSFRDRIPKRKVNKRGLQYLIDSGAFDEFGERADFDNNTLRELEEEALGVALSGTGEALQYADIIESRINTQDEFERASHGTGLTIGGEIASVKKIVTKRGQDMAFGSVVYKQDSWDITIFPKEFIKYEEQLKVGNSVMIRGRKDERGSVNLDVMVRLEELAEALEK
jgi:DNA polymerase-3 subunit alpha